ncbi:MAG TPA: pyruvate kinase [Deltaproteobacteria bacterium]|jgi:pyruvate kinase|nr:pyruvate kinase [Deltaproteobacteria bacterium]OQC29091.1 MAG: Pyruvate kinase [Deltaproteobacteria bacterium ADurb.Bin072]HRW81206.1 pyruvate kinase [Desulfomonilia bacterium]HNQ85692.1 pyruvate kinase [Deltaproteobacteria bacterium]HNS89841.1 pyruvate kinase [Deltaproteobacteria bacterium]
MKLPSHKTRIVCTIGPASRDQAVMERLIGAGMDIARINFSHDDLDTHARTIAALRLAGQASGRRITIMADLPGPKMRIGELAAEPVELHPGARFTLTADDVTGDETRASVSFRTLPQAVKEGDTLFLNDGLIQLKVTGVTGREVFCDVVAGGELWSRKGLNLPGIDLGISAFTERDHECLRFAAAHGIDALCQSFVVTGDDVRAVREAAAEIGYHPFVIAKIERAGALTHLDEILRASDGIMIARGDLGVEIPIERMAVVQKQVMHAAVVLGRPVITATQMLESMTANKRPTRAESTDVANAVLDGTDCVMLSAESAMGRYPVEATTMLGRIAAATEPFGPGYRLRERLREVLDAKTSGMSDLVVLGIETALRHVSPAAVFVPTLSGATARSIARFRPPTWIVAVCPDEAVCRRLMFSSGVFPVFEPDYPDDWKAYGRDWLERHEMDGDVIILAEGPSPKNPQASHRMEIIDLKA